MFRYQQCHIPHSSHLALMIIDNMRKYSKKYKEGYYQEVNKAILKSNDDEGKKHRKERLKNSEGAKS